MEMNIHRKQENRWLCLITIWCPFLLFVHQNEDKIYNREGQIFQEVHELEHDLQSNQKQISNRRKFLSF